MQVKGFFELLQVVVFQHQGVLHHFGRHTRAGGISKGGQAGAGFDQQGVGMAVVAAFKLDDLTAASGAAGQAQGAHAGFCAAAHQTDHLHRRHVLQNFLCQLHLAFGGCAKRKTLSHRFLHGLHHGRVTVTQNHGTPGSYVVDELLIVGVPKVRTLRPFNKTGHTANGFKGAYG